MISRKNFIRIMDALKKQADHESEFSHALEKYFDGHIVFQLNGNTYEEIAKALTDELNIKDDLLNWWMWECDFGRDKNSAWMDINEKRYALTDAGNFYEVLTMQI